MNAVIKSKTKRYKAIVTEVKAFLGRLPETKNREAEYIRSIQQEVEYLHDFINYAIFDIELYNMIKDAYKQIIVLMENKQSQRDDILGELFYAFRYLMDSIMFFIEIEYLIK